MKNILHVLLIAMLPFLGIAQNQGINYKALVKDNLGNVIANSSVDFKFTIYSGSVVATVEYVETHSAFSDPNGIVILNIGEGLSLEGDFETIDWQSNVHRLKVEVDTGSGFIDLGTTDFKSVPYAHQAKNAENVKGLMLIDEGSGLGWRLYGKDPDNYGSIGYDAVDLSNSTFASDTNGATGNSATALGRNTTASGTNSIAIGNNAEATGGASLSLGNNTEASGNRAIALGVFSTASGNDAISIGSNSRADAYKSIVLGSYNIGGGDAFNPLQTNPILEVGNGTDVNPRNALTILRNGTITAPSLDLDEIVDNKSLVTKEYIDTNATPTGLEAIGEGSSSGWRLIGVNTENYGNIGTQAVDLSFSDDNLGTRGATGYRSFAAGSNTIASGDISTAIGAQAEASGSFSMALGRYTTASGSKSIALGEGTIASGENSTAFGEHVTALGDNSTAIGYWTLANAYNGVVVGRYNAALGDQTAWIPTDPLFEIGNGTDVVDRNNAFTVLKNGNVGIETHTPDYRLSVSGPINLNEDISGGNIALRVNGDEAIWYDGNHFSWGYGGTANFFSDNIGIGTSNPETRLHIKGGTDAALASGGGYFIMGETTTTNMLMDNNEIMVRNNGASSNLYLQNEGGNVYVGGALTHTSDVRLKKDIETLPYGLKEILQLKPKQYFWKNRGDQEHKSLGLIAQEVQQLIKEIVHQADDEQQTLSVSYTELIPVLIKAIQEQQAIIEQQSQTIYSQETASAEQTQLLQALMERVKALEEQQSISSSVELEKN